MTQLRGIQILLRKCLPDLPAAENKSEQTDHYVVEIREKWLRKYGPQIEDGTVP